MRVCNDAARTFAFGGFHLTRSITPSIGAIRCCQDAGQFKGRSRPEMNEVR
jgi:hypothetical protein